MQIALEVDGRIFRWNEVGKCFVLWLPPRWGVGLVEITGDIQGPCSVSVTLGGEKKAREGQTRTFDRLDLAAGAAVRVLKEGPEVFAKCGGTPVPSI